MKFRYAPAGIVVLLMSGVLAWAQTPPDAPPAPLVIGRDPTETGEVIGKQFQIRAWVSEIGGAGMQKIYVVRLGADGNVTIPGFPPQHAEGMSIGALEAQLLAPIKPVNPKANVWISITDRNPPPATQPAATQPAPPPAPHAAAPPAPSSTQPIAHATTTQPAAQPVALATTTQPAGQPVALAATTQPAAQPVLQAAAAATQPAALAAAAQPATHPVVASATTKPASKP